MKLKFAAFGLLAAAYAAQAQSYTINTLAFGTPPIGTDASAISLEAPAAIAFDSFGEYWVATATQVFRINPFSHTIDYVVGTPVLGYSGDGGQASVARLNYPRGLAIDATHNLYIADSGNNCVRKVNPFTGIITTFAGGNIIYGGGLGDGGPAINASMLGPQGLAFDNLGNLFVADTYDNRIRRIDALTGVITTIAGNGSFGVAPDGSLAVSSSMSGPRGLLFTNTNTLYYTDGYRLRTLTNTVSGQTFSTVAGMEPIFDISNNILNDSIDPTHPKNSFIGPAAQLALDSSGRIWIGSDHGVFIYKSGLIAGFDNGSFEWGIGVDAGQNVYLISPYVYYVRKYTLNGTVTGIVPNGTFSNVAGNGNRFSSADGSTALQTQARVRGVATDTDGTVYFQEGNSLIRKIDHTTGLVSTIAGNGTSGWAPDGTLALNQPLLSTGVMKADGKGHLYLAALVGDHATGVRRIDLATGIISTVWANGYPWDMAFDRAGNLYFSEFNPATVFRVDAVSLAVTTFAGGGAGPVPGDGGPAVGAYISSSGGLALDAHGNLYISDQGRIRRVDATTGIISTYAGGGSNTGDGIPALQASFSPGRLAFDLRGNLIFTDYTANQVRRVDQFTGLLTTIAGTTVGYEGDGGPAKLAQLALDFGLGVLPDGRILVQQYQPYAGATIRALTPQPMPFLVPSFQSKTDSSPGVRQWTMLVTNTGVGAALNPRVTAMTVSTAGGPGPVSLGTTAPVSIAPQISAGGTSTFSILVNFPITSPITRATLSVTLTDDSGQVYTVAFNNVFR